MTLNRYLFRIHMNQNFALTFFGYRDWSPKFETGLNIIIGIVKKVLEWPSCPFAKMMYSYLGGSFWQKDSLVRYTFWTIPVIIFSPVSNFGDQSLVIWGYSITTWTKFRLFLTTYLPLRGHFLQWTRTKNWLFIDYLPTSFCLRSFWTTPKLGTLKILEKPQHQG